MTRRLRFRLIISTVNWCFNTKSHHHRRVGDWAGISGDIPLRNDLPFGLVHQRHLLPRLNLTVAYVELNPCEAPTSDPSRILYRKAMRPKAVRRLLASTSEVTPLPVRTISIFVYATLLNRGMNHRV
jgi:hypothetical protein